MFEVTVSRVFEATHFLRRYRGRDEAPHSHAFTLKATIAADSLNESGLAADFATIDEEITRILKPLASKILNESAPFENLNPSAENIARYIYRVLSKNINSDKHRVTKVAIFEDENHEASYYE